MKPWRSDIDFVSGASAEDIVSVMNRHGYQLRVASRCNSSYGGLALLRFSDAYKKNVDVKLPTDEEIIALNTGRQLYVVENEKMSRHVPKQTFESDRRYRAPDGEIYTFWPNNNSTAMYKKMKSRTIKTSQNFVDDEKLTDVILTMGFAGGSTGYVEQEYDLDICKTAIVRDRIEFFNRYSVVSLYPEAIASRTMRHAFHPQMTVNALKFNAMIARSVKYRSRGFGRDREENWSVMVDKCLHFSSNRPYVSDEEKCPELDRPLNEPRAIVLEPHVVTESHTDPSEPTRVPSPVIRYVSW